MAAPLVSQILAGLGGLSLLVASGFAFRAFGNARLLAEAAPTPLRTLNEGLHEVAGELRGEAGLKAPLTGRPCVWYRLLLEQRRRNRWETVLDQREALPVELEDDTGTAALNTDQADIVVSSPDRVRTGIFAVPSSELEALLARVSAPSIPPAGPFLRWREEILLGDDRVFAVGTAERNGESWTMTGTADQPLLLSDREEGEVVRYQRRVGQRWSGIALVGALVAAYGVWGIVS